MTPKKGLSLSRMPEAVHCITKLLNHFVCSNHSHPHLTSRNSTDWHKKLKQYQAKRPGLRIVDSFEAVMQLTNRISMLDPVRDGILLKVPKRLTERSNLFASFPYFIRF